jgi:hypothetical protein
MNNTESGFKLQMVCRHLRHKGMYYQTAEELEKESSGRVYWCSKTHENFGPDGEPVGKAGCCAGRRCYVG